MQEFAKLEAAQFRRPLLLNKLNKNAKFPAFVDVDEKFSVTDKLSMVNTLLQMENVTSYPFMRNNKNGRIHIHCFWFDIYTGEIWCFSRRDKTFVMINEETVMDLQNELDQLRYGPGPAKSQDRVDFQDIVAEARRNFTTSSCGKGNCDH